MELEELKAEADKMGYRLVKKQGSIVLIPCTCGGGKPHEWFQFVGEKGYIYRCGKCDKEGKLCKTKIAARQAWNQMILMEKQSND